MKKNNKSRFVWYVVGISCLLIFALMLVSSMINIGEKLRQVNKWVEIGFYALVAFIVIFFIVNPIRIIVCSPSFAICSSLDEEDHRVRKIYKKVASNMAKQEIVDDEHKLLLRKYKSYDELKLNMQIVFQDCIKNDLNKSIIKYAKTVLISTAICQNARVDMITVFTVNINMVKELVTKCGFRPTMKNLSKVTAQVFGTALIAEGLESLSLDDVLPNSAVNALGEIPFIKPVISSVTQGITNALLTIRIGCVTRKYLFRDGNCITKEDIRKSAFKDAVLLLPQVVYGTLTFIPKKVIKLFSRKDKTENTEEVSDGLVVAK